MRSQNQIRLMGLLRLLGFTLLLVPSLSRAQTVVATIQLGARPDAMVVNPVTNKIYVATCPALQSGLTVIDGQSNAITAITGLCPIALAVNPLTNKTYAVDSDSGSIVIIDDTTNSVTKVAESGSSVAVAVNSATNKIYFANASPGSNPSASVTVLDGATNSVSTIVDPNTSGLGLGAVAIAVNSATNKIYVANNSVGNGATNPGNVTVIDGATNSTTTVTDPNAISPFSVAVNSVTNKVYVANIGEGTNHGNITVIDGTTNSVTTVTDPNALSSGLNSRGFAVALNSATNKIYVANADSNNVTVIDGATNATTTVTDPNAFAPVAVAVDSVTNMIYVANAGCPGIARNCSSDGSVTIIKGATNAVTTVINPDAIGGPIALAVDATTDKIYVANLLRGFVGNATVIDGGATPISHTLSVVLPFLGGGGTVTSNPAGIDCVISASTPGTCPASFPTGTVVSLIASPGPASVFSGWGTYCTGTGACNVTMTSDEFVKATFNLLDFSITPASTALTVQPGGQVSDVITIAPLNASFGSPVQLSCVVAIQTTSTGAGSQPSCTLSPSSVTPGANQATSTMVITVPTHSAQFTAPGEGRFSSPLYAAFLPIPLALIGYGLGSKKSKLWGRQVWLMCALFLAFVVLQTGCGGGSNAQPQVQPQNYLVTVTAASGALQHAVQVTVTVQ